MAATTTFNRAKIFQTFDALPGLREALQQKEWEHEHLQKTNADNINHAKKQLSLENKEVRSWKWMEGTI